jgi:SAM-dependent methyltransferase
MRDLRGRLRHRFHEARADLFVHLIRPSAGGRLLDLGGGDGSLAARIVRRVPLEVTVADLASADGAGALTRGFRHVVLDPDGRLPIGAGDFDYVLCNSVLEHATLPKDRCVATARVAQEEWRREARAAQRRFADRIRALAPSYFVQTPHRHFPVDAHLQLPLVQYLSHDALCRLVQFTERYWIKSCQGIVDWDLLTPAEVAALFPDGRVRVERFAGVPKSIVAWRAA